MGHHNTAVAYDNVYYLVAPQDITNAETATGYVDLKYVHDLSFLVLIGNLNSGTATDMAYISVEGATTEGGTEAGVAATYRLSGAIGANTWGAVTALATTGLQLDPATHDNMALWIDVDPAALAASDYRYARVKISTPDDMANTLVAVAAFCRTRYAQTTHTSVTASASA